MTFVPYTSSEKLCPSSMLGFGLVAVLGCAPDELPLPPVVWEGEMVRARMDDPGIQVCGGTFEALDRHAALVREALLLEGDGVIEYSIGDPDFVDAGCMGAPVDSVVGCATHPEGNVFTTVPFHPHEIVHAARIYDPAIGSRSSIFEEGLAVMLGSDDLDNGTGPLEVLDRFEDGHIAGGVEAFQAGHTMAILFERYAADTFRDFDELARTASEDTAFLDVFGESKEEFAAAAESMPICEQSQWWMPLLECDGEPITADPETGLLTFTGNVSCGEPDVQGPDFGRMWTSRRFRLDSHTTIIFSYEVDMPEDATLEIVGCTGGCPERVAYVGGMRDLGSVNGRIPRLEAGEYFLRLSRPVSDDDGRFVIVIDPA